MTGRKWFCRTCCAEFHQPRGDGYWINGVWIPRLDREQKLCPYCYSREIEEMEPCPTCDGGWKVKSDHVCVKCHLRNVSEIKMFVRRFSPATLEDMTDILEGNGLVMFT